MRKIIIVLILICPFTIMAQKVVKAEQYVFDLPTINDKSTDENDPEFGMWLRCMMCDMYQNVKTSSTLKASGSSSYAADNLSDDNPQTAWVEGKADYGIGEFVTFNVEGTDQMHIYNGYQKSKASFYNNSRVKTFKVYFDNKYVGDLLLNDKPGQQQVNLSEFGIESYKTIKLEIKEVYPGKKWKDTAISELFFEGG